jgi:serine phosphatase RsbU (regulator of sigma subunit)
VVGIDAARILGMELATAPEAIGPAIGAEFGAIFATLGPRGFEALLDLPAMTDRRSLLLLHVLHRIMPAAAQVNPALMTLIVVRAVNLSLQKGNAPVSAYFCASFAHVQVVLGEPQKGYAIGQIAVRLNEMMSSQAIACAVHFVLGAFVAFWTADVSESVEHLRKGLKAALEVGDYLYACYCAMAQAVYAFQMGEPLEDVAEAVGSATELIERTGDATNRDVVGSLRRVVDRLRAATTPSTNPDDEALERRILERRNPFVISCHFQFLAIEKLLAEDRAGARACVQRARPGVPGNFNGPQDVFLEALYRAEQAHAGGTAAQDALAQLESSESTLRTWAAASPKSFGFRHALVAAELFSLRGNDAEALTAYEQAIALAREAGAIMFEALASELAGHYAERRGWSEVGRQYYLRNASVAYARWGAPKKARQLGVRVPEPRNRVGTSSVELPALDLVGDVRTGDFDAIALAKAAQALSGEIVLAKLMARLMEIAIEQAGAELGYLLLLRNGELWVEHAAGPSAKGFVPFRVSGADLSVAESSATSPMLPFARSVIDFVQHAREKVVLTHASEQHRFSSDPYLMQHRPQSLLCMPMVRQGELTGILYLENRLAADVFRPDQVNLLDMLSAQAAISLENARLYEEMEERVKDRTRKLEQSLRTIQDDQARIIEAERRAAVAHLESELAIAQRIQTSILPQDLSVVGTEIAAVMRTATEVGGDYYDLCPTEDGGFWLGIGDVSGHGLDAGLVMLMIQSSLASLMRSNAWGDPSQLLCVLNRAIYDNVRCRLGRDDYVTLSLFRFFPDGRFLVAGAHEDVLLWRARTGRCEAMQPQGTWIGMVERIEANTRTREGRLQDGDVMVLFTDGVVEARRQDQEQFGVERVMETVERFHADPANDMCRAILEQARAWSSERQDDQTVVIVRRGSRR